MDKQIELAEAQIKTVRQESALKQELLKLQIEESKKNLKNVVQYTSM